MQEMTASSPHELAALRARAYGPRADIDADPDALARLRELEEAQRAASREAVRAPDVGDAPAAPGSPPGEPTLAELVAATAITPPDGGRAAYTPRRVTVTWITAWAASLLLVAVAVGAIVFGLASIRPVSTATGATQIETLDDPVERPEWLDAWMGDRTEYTAVYSFAGMLVAKVPAGIFTTGTDCIMALRADAYNETDQSFRGEIHSACRAGVFPASVQFVVDDTFPQEMRDRFGDGTALQFVADGDLIGVFVDESGEPTPSPDARP